MENHVTEIEWNLSGTLKIDVTFKKTNALKLETCARSRFQALTKCISFPTLVQILYGGEKTIDKATTKAQLEPDRILSENPCSGINATSKGEHSNFEIQFDVGL